MDVYEGRSLKFLHSRVMKMLKVLHPVITGTRMASMWRKSSRALWWMTSVLLQSAACVSGSHPKRIWTRSAGNLVCFLTDVRKSCDNSDSAIPTWDGAMYDQYGDKLLHVELVVCRYQPGWMYIHQCLIFDYKSNRLRATQNQNLSEVLQQIRERKMFLTYIATRVLERKLINAVYSFGGEWIIWGILLWCVGCVIYCIYERVEDLQW